MVECGIAEAEDGLDPNEWKNQRGEIDFLVFINATLVKNREEINQEILNHAFMSGFRRTSMRPI